MSSQRGRQIGADERRDRERAWTAEQKKRESAWTAEFEARQKAQQAEARERELATSIAANRTAWAEGRRTGADALGYVDATGPDAVTVRIAVVWLGRFRATRKRLNDYNPFRNVDPGSGEGLIVLIPYAVLVGLDSGLRWLVLQLLGRPLWAVAAKAGSDRDKRGGNTVLLRTRDRAVALRHAAALADRVEQEGAAALTPR
ncbi:hypothetical protein ACFWJ4_04355 [Kitasatospora sp. NPDC127067]|uniref:hypothetical protein n=1 Tax=Kitasatospora sp. NPDC127067 TaxID=3347126 RepID=UPI00365DEF7A